MNDKSIDAPSRAIIRYALEINDPWLPELVRCVDAGESITDNLFVASSEEKIEALTDLIPRKLHPPKSPREDREAPRIHALRRAEPPRHGRRILRIPEIGQRAKRV